MFWEETEEITEKKLTTSDIARLAGLSVATVSNWKRRHPDFPPDRGDFPMHPLYYEDEILAWMEKHRKRTRSPRSKSARKAAGLTPVSVMRINATATRIASLSGSFSEPVKMEKLVRYLRGLWASAQEDAKAGEL
jgi:hypothetical protein